MGSLHYLPLSPLFFLSLVGTFLALVALIEVGLLRYAYLRLGVGPRGAMLLLTGSLIGSSFNIPIAQLHGEQVVTGRIIEFYGMEYAVPVVVNSPGTVVAVNVGGALIPTIMPLYLLITNELWIRGGVAIACVAAICHTSPLIE